MATSSAKSRIQDIIDNNGVAIFSKTYCGYCRAAKRTLNGLGAKFYALELDEDDDGSEIQSVLKTLTGQSTVPNIFINKKHIGGNSDLQAINGEGKLQELLKEAGAL